MGIPHKHADLIKAWADGAKIEWYDHFIEKWKTIKNPFWDQEIKYRIKPEPKTCVPYRRYLYNHGGNLFTLIYYKPTSDTPFSYQKMPDSVLWIDNDWITHELP